MHTQRTVAASAAALTLTLGVLAGCSGSGSASDDATKVDGPSRTVTDASGKKVTVPKHPKRVATLHYAATQAVYDAGGSLAGQAFFEKGNMTPKMEKVLGDTPVVTGQHNVDVEKVAKTKPDLILAPNTTEGKALKQLRDIAPVYIWTLRGKDRANWDQRVDEVADAINKKDKLAQLKKDYKDRQQSIATKYKSVIKGQTVGAACSYEADNLYAWGKNNMSSNLLTSLGYTWSPNEDKATKGEKIPEATVSNEKIGSTLNDSDVLFYDTDLAGKTTGFTKDLMKNSTFKQLPAAKSGKVYPFGKMTIAGYSDANYSLDQVEKALADIKKKDTK